jgi:Predicted glycosyltransferases
LAVRSRLAVASTGWRHLARIGADCLLAARQEENPGKADGLRHAAAQMLLWAFGESPLHGPLAAEILSAPDLPLTECSRTALAAVAGLWRIPGSSGVSGEGGLAYFERLAARRDTPALANFLAGRIAQDPAGLFWREKALALALFAGEGEPELSALLSELALAHVEAIPGLAPVAANLRAQAAFLRGDVDACLAELAQVPNLGGCFGPGFAPARAGLALLAGSTSMAGCTPMAGESSALPHLFAALAAAPWQVGLALATADVLSGARCETAPLPAPTLILLYTWNKAADLNTTLASLFHSDLSGARVVVLDNGSTDETPQVLDAWEGRCGGALSRVTLPVNIGAPAARNWLAHCALHQPGGEAIESVLYMDDDVEVPPLGEGSWLGGLGAALARFPQAGVVGCKVVDHAAPRLIQNAAGQLVIPEGDAAEQSERPDPDFASRTPNPFRLCDAHLQGPDWGLFDWIGPCSSVTGCCHLFRRSWLESKAEQGGGFSLALGPSQYDDFERDLRMVRGGGFAVYTGHVRIRHRKRSGLSAQQGAAGANAAGNRYKMQTMHSRAEIAQYINSQAERLDAHLRSRLRHLDQAGDVT